MELIKYKRYDFNELRETFFRKPTFFSRSSVFRAGCPGRADVVQAFLEERIIAERTTYSIIIKAELQNHVDYVSEALTKQGYTLNEEGWPTWTKTVRVSCKQNSTSLRLLKDTLAALDDMVSGLPMCLYESLQVKRLRDYINFMSALNTRIPFPAFVGGSGRHATLMGTQRAAQSQYIRRGFGRMDESYCIAELPNNQWSAWVVGDEYIPVFHDERLAVRFLEDRHVLYATG